MQLAKAGDHRLKAAIADLEARVRREQQADDGARFSRVSGLEWLAEVCGVGLDVFGHIVVGEELGRAVAGEGQ